MTFGIAPPRPPQEPPRQELLRVLWRVERRKQFRAQIITAAIYKHPVEHTCELRVFLGAEADNNLLDSLAARFDYTPLDERAATLRDVLLEHGWAELPSTRPE